MIWQPAQLVGLETEDLVPADEQLEHAAQNGLRGNVADRHYFDFDVPLPGRGMCSLTVVFGRVLAVPSLTNLPEMALRSPIRLWGVFLLMTKFVAGILPQRIVWKREFFTQTRDVSCALRLCRIHKFMYVDCS